MLKIAVCFSGETRDYNTCPHIWEAWKIFAEKMSQGGYGFVDFYGHTWAHCEPPAVSLPFTHIQIDDQRLIDDWVSEDLIFRSANKTQWQQVPEFQTMNQEQRFHHYLDMSRRCYGQLVSGVTSFSLVDQSYDYIIRTRWDVELYQDQLHKLIDFWDEYAAMDWPIRAFHEELYLLNCSVIAFGKKGMDLPEDFFFIISNNDNLNNRFKFDWRDVLDDILQQTVKKPDRSKPSSHTLWQRYFQWLDAIALPILDHKIAKIHRKPGTQTTANKNKWSI